MRRDDLDARLLAQLLGDLPGVRPPQPHSVVVQDGHARLYLAYKPGGIADGRGVAASLALGATGVWVGTAFLATREAFVDHLAIGYLDKPTAAHYQRRILEATEEDARIFRIFTGKTARALRSKFTEIWDKSGMSTLPMPLQWMLVADFQEGMMKLGDPDFQPLFAGQISGMITKIKGAGELMEELVDGTVNVLKKTIPAEVTIK